MSEHPAIPFNDLSRGLRRDRDLLLRAAAEVIDSGYAVHGAHHRAFESEIAEYVGVDHAVGVANGTDALELAIKAVRPAGRSIVVTAGNAGGYTSTAVKRAGLTPRYADVDATTLCLTADTVRDVLDDEVGVVVVTHLYGHIGDIPELRSLCDERSIALVEDCAQAIGADSRDGRAGTFGDAATISFYPTKNLGAVGDGGAVVTRSSEVADRVRQLRQYGWATKYDAAVSGGTNSRLDEMQAAFLRLRLPLVNGFNARRREIIARYRAAAAEIAPEVLTVLPAAGGHGAHLAICRSSQRDAVRVHLRGAGVTTDVHFPLPDWEQAAFSAHAPTTPKAHTEAACDEVFSLPLFPELTDDEVDRVCAALRSIA
ncbi:DegT/DnrJ/EryC1/StrS family aminotransferase [Microbacterium testaceum]|uniref:DegT/DnrJ/EryC1/StrS family aminotransferase n=1 Tax=Microbacterium testaceum TaxID=2033 RepID=UPI0025B1BACA|nr:aminotransferase class V-fold PLP-dependent enzyme [Microbacterium testaceum]WJS91741.1 aminotransferase class V-fold PLP-dependent enzyme [Microbacterium testaceum]